jgi:signal transduction histidine kinase
MEERTRLSNYLVLRNRELTALNVLSREIGGVEELGVMLSKAVDLIVENTGAKGGAVRLISDSGGGLELKTQRGMPAGFADKLVCLDVAKCLCGRALSDGRPTRLKDPVPAQGVCMVSWEGDVALVPLTTRTRPLGILYLWDHGEWESPEELENFLMAYGNQLSSNIENMVQMEDTKRYATRARALFQTAQALTRSLDLDDLLEIIMKEAAALLRVKRSLLLLYSEEDNLINCRVALGFSGSPAGSLSFNPSGVFWEAMEDGGVKVVDLLHTKVDVPRKLVDGIGIQKFILVPLMSKGKVLGFIVLEPEEMGGISMEDLKMVVGFASQAAVAIETSSFYIRTVERYNDDLQQLSSRIISAQEEERKRISRDLHDELGQVLTATKINLDMIHAGIPPSLEQLKLRIGDAIGLVVSALDSVRRLSFDLRPSMLDDLGLLMAAGKLVSDFKKRSGIDVDFNTEGLEDRLDTKVEVALYRVIQEALTNILKHSEAGKAVINLKQDLERGVVSLLIEDDGIGFSSHAEPQDRDAKGFGLMGIRERVSLLGGNFRIFSEEGKGTKLFIDIPCLKGDSKSWKIL